MNQEFPVTFQPGDKQVYVLAGSRLQEAATAAGLVLDAPCGGEGTCGKCRVVVSARRRAAHGGRVQRADRRRTARRLPAGLPGDRRRTDERAGARDLARRPALSDPGRVRGSGGSGRRAVDLQTLRGTCPARSRRRRAGPGPAARPPGPIAGRFESGPRASPPPAGRSISRAPPCWTAIASSTSSREIRNGIPTAWPSTWAPRRWLPPCWTLPPAGRSASLRRSIRRPASATTC